MIQIPVVYIALEGQTGIENRVLAAASEIGVDLTATTFALLKVNDNIRSKETGEKLKGTLDQIRKDLGRDACVVVLDTYTAALGPGASDVNPEDVSSFLENAKN